MAVFFQLTRIGSREPSTFQDIDNAICNNLNIPWDNTVYAWGWYDVIGFMLATGKTFQQITDYLNERIVEAQPSTEWRESYVQLRRINHFLCENYTTDAWWGL